MADVYAGFLMGIQSSSFRETKGVDKLIRKLRQVELACVELHPNHLPLESGDLEIAEALSLLQSAGIAVPALGVVTLPRDAKRCRRIFEFAEKLEVETICADPDPDGLETIERLIDEYGIAVAIHNRGPGHRWGSFETIRKALASRGEGIGMCLDTAEFLRAGEDPLEPIRTLPDRIFGIHLKDVAKDESGEWKEVILGRGGLRLGELLAALKAGGFDGFISLEYERDPKDPVPAIRECLRVIRAAAKGIEEKGSGAKRIEGKR
ncbi:MAG: sugar phosphate isomerase/epimerase [Planctomycetes bacterium]|nr:sugar phosphate isomerase/epimerase [Planctomycetota bacterium]